MYFKDASGKLCTIRGTSHVEAVNRPFNHHLSGACTSPALAQQLLVDFFGALNLRTAAKNGDAADYGTCDVSLMLELNSIALSANLPVPFPRLPKADWSMQDVRFGHEWERPLQEVVQLANLADIPDVDNDTGDAHALVAIVFGCNSANTYVFLLMQPCMTHSFVCRRGAGPLLHAAGGSRAAGAPAGLCACAARCVGLRWSSWLLV
jgi:hypothetical protein